MFIRDIIKGGDRPVESIADCSEGVFLNAGERTLANTLKGGTAAGTPLAAEAGQERPSGPQATYSKSL